MNVNLMIEEGKISDHHAEKARKMGVTVQRGIATLFLSGELNAVTYVAQVWVSA